MNPLRRDELMIFEFPSIEGKAFAPELIVVLLPIVESRLSHSVSSR